MPTKVIAADKMSVGGADGGKHWTRAEVAARQAAAEGVKRKKRVVMRIPEWLSDEARLVWRRVKRQTAGLDLLDALDVDTLAAYCDAVVQHREASKRLKESCGTDDDANKSAQTWARLVLTYAEKLGFTPAARARLVKQKADELIDEFGETFD